VPFAIVIVLAVWLWTNAEALDPYAPIASRVPPLHVQVVSYDWKWLFIYLKLKIASMGELAFPFDRPLALKLTSNTVMQSFFIPSLGSQIYTMAGMVTKLHLEAEAPGNFRGENIQYNGRRLLYAEIHRAGDDAGGFQGLDGSDRRQRRAALRQGVSRHRAEKHRGRHRQGAGGPRVTAMLAARGTGGAVRHGRTGGDGGAHGLFQGNLPKER
jgi:hypothetical protein